MSNIWQAISSQEDLQHLISGSELGSGNYFLILKHSNRCAISSMAKNRLERNSDSRLSYFLIDVIGNRSISNALSEITAVNHESPQSFLFNGSILIDVKSHMGISPGELTKRLDSLIQIQT